MDAKKKEKGAVPDDGSHKAFRGPRGQRHLIRQQNREIKTAKAPYQIATEETYADSRKLSDVHLVKKGKVKRQPPAHTRFWGKTALTRPRVFVYSNKKRQPRGAKKAVR